MSQLGSARYGNQQAHQNFSMADLERPAQRHLQDEDEDDILDYEQAMAPGRIPMNSTLMAGQLPAQFASTDRGGRVRDRRAGIPEQLRAGKHGAATAPVAYRERDITLTTQTESILDEAEVQNDIPGVGPGHGRPARNNANAVYNRHLNVHHPSPATAAKHKNVFTRDEYAHDSDESESVAESSSQSVVSLSDVGARPNPFHHNNSRAFNESTGNHQGFMHSPRRADVPLRNVSEPVRSVRPKLPDGWQGGYDHLVKPPKKTSLRSHAPATDGAESGSNESGYAAGMQHQKYHEDFVKRGKHNSGTEASTSGETLVDDGGRGAAAGHNLRLPSGQSMGKGIPSSGISFPHDVSGVSQALESPMKTRLGVEHKAIVSERIQAYAAPAVQSRIQAFGDINAYIDRMEKKVERVEDVSQNVYKEVGSLRKEWSEWRDKKRQSPFKAPSKPYVHTAVRQSQTHRDQVDSGAEDGRQYRQRLAGAQKMASEIGESMEYYRNTLAELRKEELLLIEREKNRHQERAHSLPNMAQHAAGDPANDDDVDSLRAQVDAVARQVERLRIMVHQTEPVRHIYPASSPIKPSHRRSIGVGNDNPFVQRRKVSGESAKSGSSNVRITSHPARSPFLQQQEEDQHYDDDHAAADLDNVADLSNMADVRAEQAEERIAGERGMREGHGHDEEHCLQCIRLGEKERRKAARKQTKSAFVPGTQAKPRNHSSASSAEDIEAHARALLEKALEELNGDASSRLTPGLLRLAEKQRSLLERTINEEMDEFYHEKCTYLDLAEEFKSFSPDLNGAKRRILSEHIMIAVERLEMRADRIERLRAALAATLPDIYSRGKHTQEPTPTSTSTARARNSPPIVDVHRSDDNVYDRLFAN